MSAISEVKGYTRQIETSLHVLEAVSDDTVVSEAKKIEDAVSELSKINTPLFEAYTKNLKAFDQGLVGKYGLQVARLIEFVMILAIAAKMYFLG